MAEQEGPEIAIGRAASMSVPPEFHQIEPDSAPAVENQTSSCGDHEDKLGKKDEYQPTGSLPVPQPVASPRNNSASSPVFREAHLEGSLSSDFPSASDTNDAQRPPPDHEDPVSGIISPTVNVNSNAVTDCDTEATHNESSSPKVLTGNDSGSMQSTDSFEPDIGNDIGGSSIPLENAAPWQSLQSSEANEENTFDNFAGLPTLPDAPGLDLTPTGEELYPNASHEIADLDLAQLLGRFNEGLEMPVPESLLFFPDRGRGPRSAVRSTANPNVTVKIEDTDSDIEMIEIDDSKPIGKRIQNTRSSKADVLNKVSSDKVGKGKARKGKGRPPGRRIHRGNVQQTPVADLHGLFQSNIIAQANANEGLGPQPTMVGTNRQLALKNLIASLPADEQDQHKGDRIALDEAAKAFVGRGRKVTAMRADGENGWKLKGMKSRLQHHQLLGASFMRRREMEGGPFGGVIADVMGFGKTVMCLANMVDGMALGNQVETGATLIVVPSALMSQWKAEIDKHLEPHTLNRIMIFGAGNRLKDCSTAINILSDHHIVITSYHEIMSSYPVNEPPAELTTKRAREEWWEEHLEKNKGYLHRIKWHRVVLDESQVIKNHLSRTSIAVRALEGKFRWVLSGTPVLNNLKEWYPTLDFLQLAHIGSYELFCKNFCRPGSGKALQRLQVTLGKIMLRRTHESRLFGRPIVDLPKIHPVRTIEVEFNSVERAIYTIIRDRFCKQISPIGNLGGGDNSYRSALVLLLRLRQLVGHPTLIQKTIKEVLEVPDMEQLWFLTDPSASNSGTATIDGSVETAEALQAVLLRVSADAQPSIGSQQADNEFSAELRRYLLDLEKQGDWAKIVMRSFCHACGNPPTDALVTQCKHLYCKMCLNDILYHERAKGNMRASCRECGSIITQSATWNVAAYEQAKTSNKSSRVITDAEETADWYDLEGRVLRSAKLKACVEQLREWFKQDITNKVIVFVQFRGLIRILSRILDEEQWGHVSFDGSMSFEARNKAIEEFTEKPETMILLAALKAGGVGLNLTAANKIVIIDIWWNQLTEDQAFSRAYRIGQTREVEVVRFVVKNSVDSNILKLQQRKTQEIDSALRNSGRYKLSLREIMDLFGDLDKEKDKTRKQVDERNQRGDSDESFIPPDDPYDTRINSGETAPVDID